jgi:predicted heme/steroid binding protein
MRYVIYIDGQHHGHESSLADAVKKIESVIAPAKPILTSTPIVGILTPFDATDKTSHRYLIQEISTNNDDL